MIIYGYRNREIVQGTGNFYCPKCEAQREYKHKKLVRYFTLFFIPLFPLGTLSEYVECSVCGRTYKPEILSIPSTIGRTPALESMANPVSLSFSQNPDSTPPASPTKRSSCLPWGLIATGLIFLGGACLMGVALFATQTNISTPMDVASLILALIICPGVLGVLGAVAIGGGIFLLRAREADTGS